MPVRIELIEEAVADLSRYAVSGNLRLFLKKLVWLEGAREQGGMALGGGLTGMRRIVVGDRDWRILFTMNPEKTVATVWVIGDRGDDECYREAEARLRRLRGDDPETQSLSAAMLRLMQARQEGRARKRRG